MHPSTVTPAQLIVLGASNVANCTPEIAALGQAAFGKHDLYLAAGHGRSYVKRSTVLARTLPGIGDCQIWRNLPRKSENTIAVITDIGNDILYGISNEEIVLAVRECMNRLKETTDRVVITGLPVESVAQLGKIRFLFMRSVLFPASRLTLREAIDRVCDLDKRITELAGEMDVVKMDPQAKWFGLDPIHIRRRHRVAAWSIYLRQIGSPHVANLHVEQTKSLRAKLKFLSHETKWLFGSERKTKQPTRQLDDGSRVFLF